MRIIHLILNLGFGGAENMLVKLVNQDSQNEILIITLTDHCPIKNRIKNANISVYSAFSKDHSIVRSFFRLIMIVRKFKPDIIQAWMYHSELLGLVLKLLYPRAKLFWNIRCSTSDWLKLRPRNRYIFRMLKMGFGLVSGIVVNSRKELQASLALGYPEKKLIYIPNGFENIELKDKKLQNSLLKKRFQLNNDAVMIGLVTKNHYLKDIDTMLGAFRNLQSTNANVHMILVGSGFDSEFEKKLEEMGLGNSVHIYGTTDNIFDVIRGFDIAVLSSRSESFPNVIAEYMLSAIPVVSTNVADIPEIIGDTGFVVPPENPVALSDAICSVLQMTVIEKSVLAERGRQRILQNFQIDMIYKDYLICYSKPD